MSDRDRNFNADRDNRNRDGSSWRNRQTEQFSSSNEDQFGEDSWRGQNSDRWQSSGGARGGSSERGYGSSDNYQRDDFARSGGGYRSDTSSLDDYDRQGSSRFGRSEAGRDAFGGDNFAGHEQARGGYSQSRNMQGYGAQSFGGRSQGGGSYGGNYGSSNYGANMYDRGGGSHIPPRQYDRDERGLFDRASDEVMSWFGDDDAARRRQMDQREDHRGRGPANYSRSNERLLEEACERLTRDPSVDASKINVTCEDNEITLTGTVDSRSAKRRAEDVVHDVSGVKHVQNNLRVESRDKYYETSSTNES